MFSMAGNGPERYSVTMQSTITDSTHTATPPQIPNAWREEFEAARRRPLEQRFRYAFIKTYKPVMDDATFRAFETMNDYRQWCEDNLPDWLGYGRV